MTTRTSNHIRLSRAKARAHLLAAVSAGAVLVASSTAWAESQIQFDVPKQGIEAALMSFAKQAKVQVVMEGAGLSGLEGRPLRGSFNQKDALKKLIGSAPLKATWLSETTVAIQAGKFEKKLIAYDQPAPAPAPAVEESESEIETLVVTARRREENIQTTPIAVTAVSQETLERRNVSTIEQISRLAPSLTVYQVPGRLGTGSTFLRGIGYGDSLIGQDSPVGIYIDGIAIGRNSVSLMQLIEPERIEVLRGPQGTLFGRNTAAGALVITSHTPSDEFSGSVKARYGSFNENGFQARVDTGLLGDSGVKLSAAFRHYQRNGPWDSPNRSRNLDPGSEDGTAYWFKAVGDWGGLHATLSADYSETSGAPGPMPIISANANVLNFLALSSTAYGGPAYVVKGEPSKHVSEAFAGVQRIWSEGIGLTLAYDITDDVTVKSISSTRAYKRNDPWGLGPPDIRGNVGTVAAPRIVSFEGIYALAPRSQAQRQYTQELQILGKWQDVNYVAGLFYLDESAWDSSRTRLPSIAATGLTAIDFAENRSYGVDSTSKAVFAQVDWRPAFLDHKLEVSGGVRYTKDARDFDQTAPLVRGAKLKTDNTSYLVSANYQWAPNVMTFVRYSTAYRAGGFNVRAAATSSPVYQPEKLKSFEGGFKLDLLRNRLRLNGSAFLNKYNDLQVSEFVAPSATSGGGNNSVNANAKYKGFELELQASPIERLLVTASVGYVDRDYKNYPRGLEGGLVMPGCLPIRLATGALIGQDCAAVTKFTFAPSTTADLAVSYSLPESSYGQWSFSGSYSYKSHINYVAVNFPSTPNQAVLAQKGWGLIGARIALSEIPLTNGVRGQISVFGDNLTNEKYKLQGTDFRTFAVATYGTPRTFGIEGKLEF